MIPLHLRLRNFMSYGEEGGDLDLRHIHLACLSGGNGNGKSSLVDAMTWALWGRSRAAREDDLLRQGTSEMEVEFEFALGGAVYRVIRKRVMRKSASVAVLELAVRDGDVYRAITGHTISDTERAISDLLRLSYDTFINSSLLLQGKADLFTVKRPGERKEVLAEILGLGRYEALAETARERERDYKARVERHELRIAELDRYITGIPGLQEQVGATEADLAAARETRTATEVMVADLDGRLRTMDGLRERLGQLDDRLKEIERDEGLTRTARTAAAARRTQAEALLADEPAIREQLALLALARLENDRLGTLVQGLRVLEARIHALEGTIAAESGRLDGDWKLARRAMEQALDAEQQARRLIPELQRLQAQVGALPTMLQEREELVARERGIGERISALAATDKLLDAQRKEMRKRIEGLKAAGADCPTCGAPLSEERRQEAYEAAMAEGKRSKAEMEEHEREAADLAREQAALKGEIAAKDLLIARLNGLCRKEGELTQSVAGLRRQASTLPTCRAEEERLRTLLESGAFALDERVVLVEVQAEIAALGYDLAAHRLLAERINTLASAETRSAQLESAREALGQAAMALNTCEVRLAGLAEERARQQAEREPLLAATAEAPALRAALAEQWQALEEARRREGALQEKLGNLRRQIEDGLARMHERAEAVEARDEANRQSWAHHELGIIFGKRGIQAMLIENALPELEQDANELLARMTDNSTQVQFVTQRQSSGGKAIETLEIKIADNMGTRTYEMFSGGEAFRIDFAIRIALSKLLARRAGAELSFLLIDEGFGSQDAQGRDRLVGAITSIADDFEKILVVTHIDELKEQFDVHIEVSKGLAGSQITVSAA